MKTYRQQFVGKLKALDADVAQNSLITLRHLLLFADVLDERAGGWDGERFAAPKPIGSGHSATDEEGVMTNEERTTLNGLHALRQAVEMLGNAVAGNGEQSATEQVACVPAAQFGDELVERLAVAYKTAESYNGAWSRLIDVEKTMARRGVRAMLTELAKMPCELPTVEDIASAWMGYRITNVGLNVCAMRVQRMLAPRISAVVAAKNARVSELEDQVQRLGGWERYQNIVSKRVAELEKIVAARDATIATLTEERDNARGEASSRAVHQKVADHFITEAKAQIAELGAKVANAERLAAARLRLLEVRDKNDEQKRDEYEKRIAELEAQLAKQALPSSDLDAAREAYFSLGGIESDIGPRNDSGWYWRRAAKMAIAQIESRHAKQAPPVDATGKTPGQVNREAHLRDDGTSWEAVAQAALAAFGPQTIRVSFASTNSHVNERGLLAEFVYENAIDSALPSLGFDNGKTIPRSDAPVMLNLSRGDIVEIRVVGRAER